MLEAHPEGPRERLPDRMPLAVARGQAFWRWAFSCTQGPGTCVFIRVCLVVYITILRTITTSVISKIKTSQALVTTCLRLPLSQPLAREFFLLVPTALTQLPCDCKCWGHPAWTLGLPKQMPGPTPSWGWWPGVCGRTTGAFVPPSVDVTVSL